MSRIGSNCYRYLEEKEINFDWESERLFLRNVMVSLFYFYWFCVFDFYVYF